jgi:hypothetical protein
MRTIVTSRGDDANHAMMRAKKEYRRGIKNV